MRLTSKDIQMKRQRTFLKKSTQHGAKNIPQRRRKTFKLKYSQQEHHQCCYDLWWEIANAMGHEDFIVIKMSGQTTKYTQKDQDVDWFSRIAPLKIADTIINRFEDHPQDVVIISEGDKRMHPDGSSSGVAETIHQVRILVEAHMNRSREVCKAQFICKIWGASNHPIDRYTSIFGKDSTLGSSNREFLTPPNIQRVWPGIEKCRAIKYAGNHYEAHFAADLTFRVEGDRPLTHTAISYYGSRRARIDHFVRPNHTVLAKAMRLIRENQRGATSQ